MFNFAVLAYTFLAFFALPPAWATIYVTRPIQTTTCQGGQSCLVQWLDNGEAPLLSSIGPCFVGLYNGQGVLVQQIEPVDVSQVRSLTFIPDPSAGPNSHTYYINFTSISQTNPYTQYSPFFTLTGMGGSFSAPVPSDTSSLSVPSSVISHSANSVTTTITVSIPTSIPTSASPSSVSASGNPPSEPASASSAPASAHTGPSSLPSGSPAPTSATSVDSAGNSAGPSATSLSGSPTPSFVTIRSSALSSQSSPLPSETTLSLPPSFTMPSLGPPSFSVPLPSVTNTPANSGARPNASISALALALMMTVVSACL